jgi:hypothetical protein
MQRSMKALVGSMALVALLAGVTARAQDPAPAGQATVTVKVTDADGKAAAGVRVTLGMGGGKAKGKKGDAAGATSQPTTKPAVMSATTDADGTAMIKGVTDGKYAVRASIKGGGKGRGTVTVADGKDQTVEIKLAN